MITSGDVSVLKGIILLRATSRGAPWLRWHEDGGEGNGGTPSPGVIEHPLVGQPPRAALPTHANCSLHPNPLGLLSY